MIFGDKSLHHKVAPYDIWFTLKASPAYVDLPRSSFTSGAIFHYHISLAFTWIYYLLVKVIYNAVHQYQASINALRYAV